MAPRFQCALCGHSRDRRACTSPGGKSPDFCPMVKDSGVISEALEHYQDPRTRDFARQASIQEAEGYSDRHARPCVKKPIKTRIEETWEFALRMGYRRVGLAFCVGLVPEARAVAELLTAHDLEVVSVACKVGAVPKESLGLSDDDKIRPGGHESMCNPISQAHLLNRAGTDLNVLLGLCVGHDALFFQHSSAPCTVLAVKDRVTGHNPLAAVYTCRTYYERLRVGSTDQ